MVKRLLNRKRNLVLIIALFALFGIAGSAYFYRETENKKLTSLCKTDSIGTLFKEKYRENTKPSLEEMSKINSLASEAKGSDESLECQYITLRYALDMYQLESSKAIYDRLVALAEKKNSWVDESITEDTSDGLKLQIDNMSEKIEKFKGNVIMGGLPNVEPTESSQ